MGGSENRTQTAKWFGHKYNCVKSKLNLKVKICQL